MSFEIRADGLDGERLRADVQNRVEERRRSGLYTEEEIRFIAERALEGVLAGRDIRADLVDEFRRRDAQWNYAFDPETLYRSSRGLAGRALEVVRRLLRPVQKLFWNPNPMIAALSRQSDLNRFSAHLLHNLVLELTRLSLEVQELRNRNLQLQGRLEALARREKALEGMVAFREGAPEDGGA
jgi:hypothetical protein